MGGNKKPMFEYFNAGDDGNEGINVTVTVTVNHNTGAQVVNSSTAQSTQPEIQPVQNAESRPVSEPNAQKKKKKQAEPPVVYAVALETGESSSGKGDGFDPIKKPESVLVPPIQITKEKKPAKSGCSVM
jgi:hypothetical protein